MSFEEEENVHSFLSEFYSYQIYDNMMNMKHILQMYSDTVAVHYGLLVPNICSFDEFWSRYYYRCSIVQVKKDLIARQLEAHSAAPTVTQSAQAQRLPLRLVSELRDFGLRQSEGKLLAELSLSARLICTPDARVLGAKVLNLESGPVTDDPALAIAALRALSGSLALQVSDWLGTVDARSCLDP